ncbi:MAG: HAD-IC family P-type ATPase, partial [Pseudomonadota bacterium]|nr:HAD-IC family P-type ATPase [Pseudomonadota bacterium]
MSRPPSAPSILWHTLSADQAAARLDATPATGLSDAEAARRLERHGPNRLARKPPRPAWRLFLDQFANLLIIVLLGAAVLSGAIGHLRDAVVILAVVVLNAVLGFYQEQRAEQTLAALKKMLAQQARVRRDGHPHNLPAEQLVPGDVVLLEAGDRVPADGRILAAHRLEIDESALTGESQPVAKAAGFVAGPDTPLAERRNLAFMNTVVTRGRLELLVTATGMATEMGRLARLLEEAEEGPTPLQVQLDQLGKRLAAIAGVVVSLLLVMGLARGAPLIDTILTAVALAVAAIPEGLPAVVTVTLALGMRRMAKNRAIVKRLAAVETLGCTTVICSDKTGTLTRNQMTARAVWFDGRERAVNDEDAVAADVRPLLLPAALCNDSRIRQGQVIGDPTEGALLALAAKGGIDAAEAAR